jgi:phosphatidylglycerol:prolipoprotein diacylglycerol transferase
MLPLIPYFQPPSFSVGPLTIHAFGIVVATSVLVGLSIGKGRFQQLGLDPAFGERMAWWLLAGGFLGAHFFALLFYYPRKIVEDPWSLVRVWEDISSFGGIIGAALALLLFMRGPGRQLSSFAKWRYVDVAGFVFPISLMIGRIGCALAHDHPGAITRFPLAISLRSVEARAFITNVYAHAGRASEVPDALTLSQLGFHDLGWYEFLFLAAVVVPTLVALKRGSDAAGGAPPGTFVLTFLAMYLPVRFFLDFLRVSDARYLALTPAQWTCLLALLVLPVVFRATRGLRHDVSARSASQTRADSQP